MSVNRDDHKSVEAILARAHELASGEQQHGTCHAEVLAALADGTVSFEDIPDIALQGCVDECGADFVVDAVMAAGPARGVGSQIRSDQPVKSLDGVMPITSAIAAWWRRPRWIAAAASLAAVAMTVLVIVKSSKNPTDHAVSGIKLALEWPSNSPVAHAALKEWALPTAAPPQVLPDFSRNTTTLGDSGKDEFMPWRLATVIVKSGKGWGSGALISADGWILSTYRIVAGQAQRAAVAGTPATLEVITGRMVNGRIKPRAPLTATLYRADPVHDLALLKLQALATGGDKMLHFQLAAQARNGEDCFAVGSQSNGPAWWIRSGNVRGRLHFPEDRSRFATVGGFDRRRATIIVTDVRVSPGDSGAPLLNARGELIGLTTTLPGNLRSSSVAWHLALPDLRNFVRDLPNEPAGVPFDIWTAGLPEATMLGPEPSEGARYGGVVALRYVYTVRGAEDATGTPPHPAAVTLFVDFNHSGVVSGDPLHRVPFGLWGLENHGRFRAKVFLCIRADEVAAAGYANDDGTVDEIRMGRSGQDAATVIWRRNNESKWYATKPSNYAPLIDIARVGVDKLKELQAIAGKILAPAKEQSQR